MSKSMGHGKDRRRTTWFSFVLVQLGLRQQNLPIQSVLNIDPPTTATLQDLVRLVPSQIDFSILSLGWTALLLWVLSKENWVLGQMGKFVLKESFLYDVFFYVVGTVYLRKINCIDCPIGFFFFFYIIFIVHESFNSQEPKMVTRANQRNQDLSLHLYI